MELKNENLLSARASERERSRSTQEYFSRYKIPSGCAIFGIMDESGNTFSGSQVIDGIALMHDRSNGLGGGFAAYGIYPQYSFLVKKYLPGRQKV